MFKLDIRDAQMKALAQGGRRRYVRGILDDTRRAYPGFNGEERDESELLTLLDSALAGAPALGIVVDTHLRRYGCLVLRLGLDPGESAGPLRPVAHDPALFGTLKVEALLRVAGLEK